jgi:hypothetical protein
MTSCANSAWVNDRTASARTNRSDLVAGGPRRSPRHRPRNRAADCSLLDRYLANRSGDAKKLKSPLTGFRLKDENTITITALRNRREAYR